MEVSSKRIERINWIIRVSKMTVSARLPSSSSSPQTDFFDDGTDEKAYKVTDSDDEEWERIKMEYLDRCTGN